MGIILIVILVVIIGGVMVAMELHADPQSIQEEEHEQVEKGEPPVT